METLSEADRNQFELIESIDEKSYTTNNSIEAFFIERAKQLLKSDGVAGIIAPSSILSKGSGRITARKTNVYVAAREILLRYFDIVAIAEFGSGTFGKTGTNTVTLFLRRRKQNPAPADHYRNRIESWFRGNDGKNAVFDDEHFIRSYCNHLEYDLVDYKTLLQGAPNDDLLKSEMFVEYRQEFDNLADIKRRKRHKSFKALSKPEQQAEMAQKFLEYVQAIEKDKLYYFVLASLTPTETVIVRSPSKTADMKKFLGYEWRSAKGNEGIKYLGGQQLSLAKDVEDDETLEQDDKRVLENLLNLNNIHTPLYDPHNLHNGERINSLIRAAFNGEAVQVPEALQEFVTTARLVDMLDFSRKEFDKTVSLTPKKEIVVETKWPVKKLSDVVDIISGGTPKTNVAQYWNGDILWLSVADFNNESRFVYDSEKKITELGLMNSNTNYLEVGDVIISARGTVGALAQIGVKATFNQSCYGLRAREGILNDFLYFALLEVTPQ